MSDSDSVRNCGAPTPVLEWGDPACPLCAAAGNRLLETEDARRYYACPRCSLIYLHPKQRLSAPAERARYELHENERADRDYVGFLRRLADPMIERLQPGAHGLDFGCGPVPVLAELLTSAGFPCVAYDPFFAPNEELLDDRYDYITCSEVVEHAHDPAGVFATLHRLLASDGLLGVMTSFYTTAVPFAGWWYRRDPTHVCFYNEETMRWIGERHGWETSFPVPNVTLFAAPPARP